MLNDLLYWGGITVAGLAALALLKPAKHPKADDLQRLSQEALDNANELLGKGICPSCNRFASFHEMDPTDQGTYLMQCANCGEGWGMLDGQITAFKGIVNRATYDLYRQRQLKKDELRRAA